MKQNALRFYDEPTFYEYTNNNALLFDDMIGNCYKTYSGQIVQIIKFIDNRHVVISFDDNSIQTVSLFSLEKGIIFKSVEAKDIRGSGYEFYIDKIFPTCEGYWVKVVDFKAYNDITIEFIYNGYRKRVDSKSLKSGNIKNPYHPNKYGGYVGVGKYAISRKTEDGIFNFKLYTTWFNILSRTNFENQFGNTRNIAYDNTKLCEEWYNFQKFAEWYDSYLKSLNPQYIDYQIDKDILQWNYKFKIYSPQTCCLIPRRLNDILIGQYISDNKSIDLPLGVTKVSDNNYCAMVATMNNGKNIYGFKDPMSAFNTFKTLKEAKIKELALFYYNDNAITKTIYDAICNIEILPYERRYNV